MSAIAPQSINPQLLPHAVIRPATVNLSRPTSQMIEQILKIRPGRCIGCWPQNELSGDTLFDYSGNNFHGTNNGAEQGKPGLADGMTVNLYDGMLDLGNIGQTGFRQRFNPLKGTALLPLQTAAWTDGANRFALTFLGGTNDFIRIIKPSTSNQIQATYRAGGVSKNVTRSSTSPSTWFLPAMTWDTSADQFKFYYNAVQVGTTQTGLGTWSVSNPPILLALIGTQSVPATVVWSGLSGPLFVWDDVLTITELAQITTWMGIS